jgi:hypothetical protein
MDYQTLKDIRVLSVFRAECPTNQLIENGNQYSTTCPFPNHGRWHKQTAHEAWSLCFTIDDHFNRWFCNGECHLTAGGDAVEFIYHLRGQRISRAEAAKYLLEHRNDCRKRTHERAAEKRPVWNWKAKLQPFDVRGNGRLLAAQRGLTTRPLWEAIKRGLLWQLESREGLAWVVTDSTRRQAVWRRLDGELWQCGAKAKLLSGCSGKGPIGVDSSLPFREVIVVEGGPDMLAALQLCEGRMGVICMPNAHSEFGLLETKKLMDRRFHIVGHADEAGSKAALRWQGQLGGQLHSLKGSKDLNDYVVEGGTDLVVRSHEREGRTTTNLSISEIRRLRRYRDRKGIH